MKPYCHVEDTWAYRIGTGDFKDTSTATNRSRINLYEKAVEHIETGVEFSVASIFRTLGGWGTNADSIAKHVVKDMLTYGLIECVKKDKAKRCLLYRRIP